MQSPTTPMEMWAGLECTLNRVGDVQHDQLALTGHYDRHDDIARLVSLGVRVVRYPILWERMGGEAPESEAWRSLDERMGELLSAGIEPIVGLVHHGSGPLSTDLLDEGFAKGLAAFARRVAMRYPWVTRFTPVNEPLTTARFSALYGAWYPHLRDGACFLRATLNQVRAIRLAMEAIRTITPDAQLLQTEDLGRVHARAALRYQADFENERRWLTFDLLTCRVARGHPMHEYARWLGIAEDEIAAAVGDGCTPELLGINHYVTSERWLDERIDRYPLHTHGGNDRQRYADVEAVRAMPEGVAGPRALLLEAWSRYHLPIVVSEAHLGCTREQQLRWLHEVWTAAKAARDEGADVRAVTAWAAFGAQDWSSLVTTLNGHYEPGLFDIRGAEPRATALATMVRALAVNGLFEHPVLDAPGWWRCPGRLSYDTRGHALPRPDGRPILAIGTSTSLASVVALACAERGLACAAFNADELDVTDRATVVHALETTGAWAVIDAVGFSRGDDFAAITLNDICADIGLPLVTLSPDLVPDGRNHAQYVEAANAVLDDLIDDSNGASLLSSAIEACSA